MKLIVKSLNVFWLRIKMPDDIILVAEKSGFSEASMSHGFYGALL
jgi:hypothetical protein